MLAPFNEKMNENNKSILINKLIDNNNMRILFNWPSCDTIGTVLLNNHPLSR